MREEDMTRPRAHSAKVSNVCQIPGPTDWSDGVMTPEKNSVEHVGPLHYWQEERVGPTAKGSVQHQNRTTSRSKVQKQVLR